jgi:hypothetical protein
MNFGEVLEIKDLGKHPAASVIHLGILLAGTVNARPDPKRKNFYEVQGGCTVYYIHVSPVGGTIFLLASWRNVFPPAPRFEIASVTHPCPPKPRPRGFIGRATRRGIL